MQYVQISTQTLKSKYQTTNQLGQYNLSYKKSFTHQGELNFQKEGCVRKEAKDLLATLALAELTDRKDLWSTESIRMSAVDGSYLKSLLNQPNSNVLCTGSEG